MAKATTLTAISAAILVAGLAGAASTKAAPPVNPMIGDNGSRLALIDAPMTVEASLGGLAATPPGRTWTMPLTGAFYCDGLALVGVSITRSDEPGAAPASHTFDVVVQVKAWPQIDDKVTDFEFVVLGGGRQLSLGRLVEIRVKAGETKSFSQRFAIDAPEFDAFFAIGSAPTLRVIRTTRSL